MSLIDEDPVRLGGYIDAAGALQLEYRSQRLADYGQALQVEHGELRASDGIVRIELHDFESDSEIWTIEASHFDEDSLVSWARIADGVYHDFGPTPGWLRVKLVATGSVQRRQVLGTMDFRARATGGLYDTRHPRSVYAGESEEATYAATRPAPEHPPWLTKIYMLVVGAAIDAAIDCLFDHVNDLLFEDQLEQCNDLLSVIDLERLDTNLLVALLSVTAPARSGLPDRPGLVARIEKRLATLAPDRLEKLMLGLR